MDQWAKRDIRNILAESHIKHEERDKGFLIHDSTDKSSYTVGVTVENGLVIFGSRITGPISGAARDVSSFLQDVFKKNETSTLVDLGLSTSGSIIAKSEYPTYVHQERIFFDNLSAFEHLHKHTLPEIRTAARKYRIRFDE